VKFAKDRRTSFGGRPDCWPWFLVVVPVLVWLVEPTSSPLYFWLWTDGHAPWRAQAAAADVIAAAAAHRTGEAGQVRLGTGATACIYLLPAVLAALRRRMPGLAVTIATGNTPEILRRLEGGDLDIALVTLAARSSRALATVRLFSDPLVAVVPNTMAPDASRLRASQLSRLPLVLYESGSNTRTVLDAWFSRAGVSPRPMMELGSVEAIKAVIAGGLGASVLPRLALTGPIPGTVTRQLYPPLARELGYVLRREKVVDRGLRTVIEALEALRSVQLER
jgi:DNA-binding transcriptional LysR family regulator